MLARKISLLLLFLFFHLNAYAALNELPSWYITPKQNDENMLYGVGEGFTLEEATKSALADMAAKLMTSISSESTLLREESQVSTNEELRQQIKQNIEKIDFINFKVSNSKQIEQKVFVEVSLEKSPFLNAQKEKLAFLDRQISDMRGNLSTQNVIQKRQTLGNILNLLKQAEILATILESSGDRNVKLAAKLDMIADTKNQLNKLNYKLEFYILPSNKKQISDIVINALNKEKMVVARVENSGQIRVSISSNFDVQQVYGSYLTKLRINFENRLNGNVIASNIIEVFGSSVISEKEAYLAAIQSLKDKIEKEGILKVLGVI